jgi:hypothetical protein
VDARIKSGHDAILFCASLASLALKKAFTAKDAKARKGTQRSIIIVMAGLDPAIQVSTQKNILNQCAGVTAWMPGSSPGMTFFSAKRPPEGKEGNRYFLCAPLRAFAAFAVKSL